MLAKIVESTNHGFVIDHCEVPENIQVKDEFKYKGLWYVVKNRRWEESNLMLSVKLRLEDVNKVELMPAKFIGSINTGNNIHLVPINIKIGDKIEIPEDHGLMYSYTVIEKLWEYVNDYTYTLTITV